MFENKRQQDGGIEFAHHTEREKRVRRKEPLLHQTEQRAAQHGDTNDVEVRRVERLLNHQRAPEIHHRPEAIHPQRLQGQHDEHQRHQVERQKQKSQGDDAVGLDMVRQPEHHLRQRRIEGCHLGMVDAFLIHQAFRAFPFQIVKPGQLGCALGVVSLLKRLRVLDEELLEAGHFHRRELVGVDIVGEYLAVPQITIHIIFLNLLRGQECGAEQQAENDQSPQQPGVVARPFPDDPHDPRVTGEQAEIDRQVSQDRAVAVTFAPVELVRNMPHRQVQDQAEDAEEDQEDSWSHKTEVSTKVFASIVILELAQMEL